MSKISVFSEVWLHGCLGTRLLMLSMMGKVRMTYDIPEGPWKVQNVHFSEVWLHGCLGTRLLMPSMMGKIRMTNDLPEGPECPFFRSLASWVSGNSSFDAEYDGQDPDDP
jgi:hypothetical protein